jgi:exodeoxyribonuclease III
MAIGSVGTDTWAAPRRIVVLNVRGGGGVRAARLCGFLEAHDPDTVVLTEWRNGVSGAVFADWAAGRDMRHAGLADGGTANGVFVASKCAFRTASVTPAGEGAGVLMLVHFAGVSLLACYFPQGNEKSVFFDRCAQVARLHGARPFMLVGDLNTGNQAVDRSERAGKYFCAEGFDGLCAPGGLVDLWRLSNGEAREWTWLSNLGNGFRIDHALGNARYVRAYAPSCRYDHSARSNGLTDHSAVVVG